MQQAQYKANEKAARALAKKHKAEATAKRDAKKEGAGEGTSSRGGEVGIQRRRKKAYHGKEGRDLGQRERKRHRLRKLQQKEKKAA